MRNSAEVTDLGSVKRRRNLRPRLTGHKTRSVFERYNIVSDGDLDAAAVRLNGIMGVAGGSDKNKSADQIRRATSAS